MQDAVAAGELHRTTGQVLHTFARASSDRLDDVWVAQATVARQLGLATSTVCHHVTIAKRAGWLTVQHRNRIDHGVVLAMTNVTRMELPTAWRTKLDEQARRRRADQTVQRRRRPGRTTEPAARRQSSDDGGSRRVPSASQQAASSGAALARVAPSFEQGRADLEALYRGSAELYEAAYDAYSEIWKSVRLIE